MGQCWSQAFSAPINSIIKVSNQDYVLTGSPANNAVNSQIWLAKITLTTTTPTLTLPFIDNFANLDAWTGIDGTWDLVNGGVQALSSQKL